MIHKILSHLDSRMAAGLLLFSVFVLTAQLVMAQGSTIPETKPDAVTGQQIFSGRCANCHGPAGAGDGEMAARLPTPPKAFTESTYRRTAVPADMFNQVTNGNLDVGMPPFGVGVNQQDPISSADIWNLIGAVYSLSTPKAVIEQGQVVYEDNCLACHGEAGLGDGPDGGDAANLDLTRLDYWFSRTNEAVFSEIAPGKITEHAYELSEEEQWAVVDYARTFSYIYHNAAEPIPLIATAVVSGTVTNGTTEEPVGNVTAQLRGFTTSFEQTLNMTTTVSADGVYQFNLEEVDPGLVFLTGISYEGLNFSSDAKQLTQEEPALDLPVTVFEQTNDASAVQIDQMHVVLSFLEGRLEVTELYVLSNQQAAVFVGETGQPDAGVVKLSLPADAENVSFERTLGSLQNTIQANEVIQTADGWADTLPLRPGQGVLNLIVRYELPYEDGLDFSHQVMYPTANITAIFPDAGVTLGGESWLSTGAQQMQDGGSFQTYQHDSIAGGGDLTVSLDGRPQQITDLSGAVVPQRNTTTDILIGAGVLLLVVGAVFFISRSWRRDQDEDAYDDEYITEDDLLEELAELDEAFENGEIDEKAYRSERKALKAELKAIWEE